MIKREQSNDGNVGQDGRADRNSLNEMSGSGSDYAEEEDNSHKANGQRNTRAKNAGLNKPKAGGVL